MANGYPDDSDGHADQFDDEHVGGLDGDFDTEFDGDFDDAETADEPNTESPLLGEATRLLGVVQDWARQTFPAPPDGHGGPDCQWCPLCQFAAVLRGERPEVTERVAEAGTALMSAMKAFIDVAASSAPGASSGAQRPRPQPPHVQPIDLGFGAATGEPDSA